MSTSTRRPSRLVGISPRVAQRYPDVRELPRISAAYSTVIVKRRSIASLLDRFCATLTYTCLPSRDFVTRDLNCLDISTNGARVPYPTVDRVSASRACHVPRRRANSSRGRSRTTLSAVVCELARLSTRWPRASSLCTQPLGSVSQLGGFEALPKQRRRLGRAASSTQREVADLVALDPTASAVNASHIVVTCSWSASEPVTARDQAVTDVDSGAQHWRSVSTGDAEFESWIHSWVSDHTWAHSALHRVFALVANDWTSDVIVCDLRCTWLYHPYDGGAEILAPSEAVRDSLAQRHRSWLSGRPDGL